MGDAHTDSDREMRRDLSYAHFVKTAYETIVLSKEPLTKEDILLFVEKSFEENKDCIDILTQTPFWEFNFEKRAEFKHTVANKLHMMREGLRGLQYVKSLYRMYNLSFNPFS